MENSIQTDNLQESNPESMEEQVVTDFDTGDFFSRLDNEVNGGIVDEPQQAQPSQNNTILTIGSAGNVVLAGSWVEVYCDGTNWLATGAVSGDSADINTCSFSS